MKQRTMSPEESLAVFVGNKNTLYRLTQALDEMANISRLDAPTRDDWKKLKYDLLLRIDKLFESKNEVVRNPNYCHNCGDPNGHGPAWVRCPLVEEGK